MTDHQGYSYRTFIVVWFGQSVSALGTGLTLFGVSVWVYLETGSLAALAATSIAAILPRSLLSPFAGVYVDRWDRRTALLVSDAGSGVATVVLAILFLTDTVSVPALTAVIGSSSAFAALQWPAYQATTTLLVPKAQYSRAQGLIQLSDAAGSLIPPALAALILSIASVGALVVIDIATFLVAVATLVSVRFPPPPPSEVGVSVRGSTVLQDAGFGFVYIHRRRGLAGLLGFQFLLALGIGFTILLLTGYILTVSTEQTLGVVSSVGALGFLAGAVLMTAWKGATDRKVLLVAVSAAGVGVSMVMVGLSTSLLAVALFMFAARLVGAIENATYRALWQAKVEPDVQGRVFSARAMVVLLGMPVAFVLTGPLMSVVFEPALALDSAVGSALRAVFGEDPAAPFRAFFAASGASVIAIAAVGWAYGPLRHLERDIPDFR